MGAGIEVLRGAIVSGLTGMLAERGLACSVRWDEMFDAEGKVVAGYTVVSIVHGRDGCEKLVTLAMPDRFGASRAVLAMYAEKAAYALGG